MPPSPKLVITIVSDVHAHVLAAAASRGVTVSAWITDAARLALKVHEGRAAVAEWEAEHGALTEVELKAARRRVPSSGRPRRTIRRRRPA